MKTTQRLVKFNQVFIAFLFLCMFNSSAIKAQCIDPTLIDPNANCTAIYDPVCGCDGNIYSNSCVAQTQAGVTSWVSGECAACIDPSIIDQSISCIAVYDPVCGCDGNTYSNSCVAEFYNGITSWTAGACAQPCIDPSIIDQSVSCIAIYDPVCGCDGNTYSNSCVAEFYNGITSWTGGACSACPTPTSIAHTIYSGNVSKLEWAMVSGAQKYKVRYRPVGGSWTEVNAPTNQRFLNGLAMSTVYQYQVKTDCGNENSVWSTTQTFTTTNEHCDYPANYVTMITPSSARVAWEIFPNVTKHKLKYKPKNLGMPWTEETIYGWTKDLTNLFDGTTYKYKLKAKCSSYWTNWGPTQEFLTPVYFNDNTARKAQLNNQTIKLYPNPATTFLNIELENNALIEVFNIVGQEVHTQEGTNGVNELNLSTLTKGSYLVRITTGENQVLKKFVKQ